jgi:signal transduction histidine kinase
VSQVVHDYGDVCQSITELAVETDTRITAEDFHSLNACLDDAIARAVTEYGRERGPSVNDSRKTAAGTDRLEFLARELRNAINVSLVAFQAIKTGRVGTTGSTGVVLQRSLVGLDVLIGRSLAEVSLTQGLKHPEPFLVRGFIERLLPAATLAADARGITLTVMPVGDGVAIQVDRLALAAAVGDVLQNAVNFTRAGTTVTLRVVADAERVLIEIQDECGGLPGGDVTGLFRPFEQRSADGAGLGLGLAFSRSVVEANHGRLYARNLPGAGCVFTVDLPRLPIQAPTSQAAAAVL